MTNFLVEKPQQDFDWGFDNDSIMILSVSPFFSLYFMFFFIFSSKEALKCIMKRVNHPIPHVAMQALTVSTQGVQISLECWRGKGYCGKLFEETHICEAFLALLLERSYSSFRRLLSKIVSFLGFWSPKWKLNNYDNVWSVFL